MLYSIRDGSHRRLTDFGEKPVWLADGRSLVFASERGIWIVDREEGKPRELYSVAPSGLSPCFGVAPDRRSIYASLTASNEEIWIADLPQ